MGTMCAIKDNNKLIAEFMGKKHIMTEDELLSIEHKPHYPTVIEDLKYDSDWNWLMEVVEKIESLEDNRFLFQMSTRQGFYAEVRERFSYETKIEDAWGKTRIEAVYNACVEFIKWYNN